VALRANHDVGHRTLTSITTRQNLHWLPQKDRDFTGLPVTTERTPRSRTSGRKLRSAAVTGDLDLVLGAYVYQQKIRTQVSKVQRPTASSCLMTRADGGFVGARRLNAKGDIRLDSTSAAISGSSAGVQPYRQCCSRC
jgi:iron complex outermembrane receptor protein